MGLIQWNRVDADAPSGGALYKGKTSISRTLHASVLNRPALNAQLVAAMPRHGHFMSQHRRTQGKVVFAG